MKKNIASISLAIIMGVTSIATTMPADVKASGEVVQKTEYQSEFELETESESQKFLKQTETIARETESYQNAETDTEERIETESESESESETKRDITDDDSSSSRKDGLLLKDGQYKLYKNGSVDTDYTEFAKTTEGQWVYLENGVSKDEYTGLVYATIDGDYAGWYCDDGYADLSYTGLCVYEGMYYYCKDGRADNTYNSLCKYDGSWWCCKDGVVDYTYTGLCEYNGHYFYCVNSKVNFGYNSLCKYNGSWWRCKNGEVDFTYNGLCEYNGHYFYCVNSKVNFGYNSLCKYDGSWWRCKNGEVDFTYNGLCEYNGHYFYCVNSKVNFGYNSLCKYDGSWWRCKNGEVDFTYNGLCEYNGKYFYCANSKVNFGFNGVCEYDESLWYCKNGEVDPSFNGSLDYNGVNYYFVNGKAPKKEEVSAKFTGLVKKNGAWVFYKDGQYDATLTNQLNSTGNMQNSYFLTNLNIPGAVKHQYGTSGEGRALYDYTFGTGKRHFVIDFAIHGWEDHWSRDGYELFRVGIKLMEFLSDNIALLNAHDFSVTVIPAANPDGLASGTTNNGPGRCTTYRYNSSGSLVKGGVDLNRCFPTGFSANTSARYYTGPSPLMAKEAKALKSLLDAKKGSSTNLYINTHGWTGQILTSPSGSGVLYSKLKAQFSSNTAGGLAGGYSGRYAASIGYSACLFEFPRDVSSHGTITSKGYDTKFIQAVANIIKSY